MTFPLAKLGFLLMKQLSRPLANFIKNEAKQHEFFRKNFCIPPARVYHWVEMHSKLRKIRDRKISYAPLTEEEEVELGANLLGEVILFSLMSVILFFEIARQGDVKAVKQQMKDDEIRNVVDTISDLLEEVNDLQKSVKIIEKKLETSIDDIMEFEEIKFQMRNEPSQLHLKDYLNYALKTWKKSDYEDDFITHDPYSP